MKLLNTEILERLWFDPEARRQALRRVVMDRMVENLPRPSDDHIVATYFFAFRTNSLAKAVKEISYHATSGVKDPPPGSLLEACSAVPLGVDPFDETERMGLLHIGFPLKMMLQPDGHLTSADILHTTAAAIIFDVYENQDSCLVGLQIPEKVIRTFPGPAYGPKGVRELTRYPPDVPAFGTILKPTAGITPVDVERLVEELAACPLFLFIKEDEDLYPNLDYSPVIERTRRAAEAVRRTQDLRGGQEVLFAPHISAAPHEILDIVHSVLEAGATAVMFSETFSGGTVRMVREATRHLERPPAIYGHNAGIGVKTGRIWREVIDLLARLDGIDFRQTSPVHPGTPFLKPYGLEWEASEEILVKELPGIKPTTIVRAGALDQGNIGLNLADVEKRGIREYVLFLSGSAINSIKNSAGVVDPKIGADAMLQAIEVYKSGALEDVPAAQHARALLDLARDRKLAALTTALHQRYPGL